MTDATRFPLRSVWVSETSKLIRNMSKSFYKDFFYVKLFFSNPKYQYTTKKEGIESNDIGLPLTVGVNVCIYLNTQIWKLLYIILFQVKNHTSVYNVGRLSANRQIWSHTAENIRGSNHSPARNVDGLSSEKWTYDVMWKPSIPLPWRGEWYHPWCFRTPSMQNDQNNFFSLLLYCVFVNLLKTWISFM